MSENKHETLKNCCKEKSDHSDQKKMLVKRVLQCNRSRKNDYVA